MRFIRPLVLFPPYSSRHLPQREMCPRNSKKLTVSDLQICFVFGLFSGIKKSITAIAVMELFIPRNMYKRSEKAGLDFGFPRKSWDNRKRKKEKIFLTERMAKRRGEDKGVPASYSRRPGFQCSCSCSSPHYAHE